MEIFWVIAPAFGIWAGFILAYTKYQEKKQKKEKEEFTRKCEELKRVNQSKLGFFRYLYFVYFIRSKLRPLSTFCFWILDFGFLPGFIFLPGNIRDYYEPVLKLEEMKTDVGIVQKIHLAYRGSDSLELLRDDGSIAKYSFVGFKKKNELIKGKKIKIYYKNLFSLFYFQNHIYNIKLNNNFISGTGKIISKDNEDNYINGGYLYNLQKQQNAPTHIIFWSIYNLIFLLWMFYFNYKEKPIHRLHRIRKLHGKQMAM